MTSQNTDALAIPDAAYTAGERAASRHFPHPDYAIDPVEDALNAAAPLVVAAELRRIADDIAEDAALIKRTIPANAKAWTANDRADIGRVIQGEDNARALRRRADELDPGTPATTRED